MFSETYFKEGNAIIAEFCNLKWNKPCESNSVEWWEKLDNSIDIDCLNFRCFMPKLYFHKSWDWLMPVIEKIEKEILIENKNVRIIVGTTCVKIDEIEMRIFDDDKKLLKTWECVVKFLRFLNTSKQEV